MRKPRSVKLPPELVDAYEILRQPGGAFDGYPSFNAWMVGLALYAITFPKRHKLTVAISRMHPDDQGAIHRFLLESVRTARDLAAELPKPATAAALLKLARSKR